MIHVLDEILVNAEHLPAVLTLLQERNLGDSSARGLALLNRWVSPPVAIPGESNTLWLLWQLPDVFAYYGMRAAAGLEVIEFWSAVDQLAHRRRRHVLTDAEQPLPEPLECRDAV
ncbi:hypothetical protein A6V36_31740 [Paraburkholderia ginsengiterrae]|uniref:Uncharacterized protein n=1 Tax=Paraburkholderia ginsengiterrae TaxID=1462993 RepID=A0A1A9N571_9BURK|nr:hypothetical protein [Paraburkholderia ginsengiterrae]OAJ57393.1 hypothetical protein A6V36_31740 [Paraburkholderia ginsengiterrae]OAJ58993.1 hypothetical protein A6V37_28340 [Paraburkholderia ginsengiterrae]